MEKESLLTSNKVRTALVVFLALASLYVAANFVTAVKNWQSPADKTKVAEITVSGKGDAFAVPDIATFTYTVNEEGSTVQLAQNKSTTKTNKALDYLKKQGIEEKDIKTVGYYANPKYEYQQAASCRTGYCPPGKQVLIGYQVSQTIEVKVRDTAKAGEILTGIGSVGVENISGLQFTVDDEDKITAEAREKAIADAKAKAEQLAKDLGVRVVRITSFSENSGGYPMYFKNQAYDMATEGRGGAAAVPSIPTGENKVTSNVTITYEVR